MTKFIINDRPSGERPTRSPENGKHPNWASSLLLVAGATAISRPFPFPKARVGFEVRRHAKPSQAKPVTFCVTGCLGVDGAASGRANGNVPANQ